MKPSLTFPYVARAMFSSESSFLRAVPSLVGDEERDVLQHELPGAVPTRQVVWAAHVIWPVTLWGRVKDEG